MKFDRVTLIDRVKAEIKRRETEAKERTDQAATEHAEAMGRYIVRTGPAWSRLADVIRKRVRNMQPMTNADIPVELGGTDQWQRGIRVQTWDDRDPAVYTADVSALGTLLALLESSPSEQVTTTELENMGFKMRELFRTR